MSLADPPTADRQNTRANWVLGIIGIITMCTLIGGIWALPAIMEGRDSSVAVARQSDVLVCRAALSAALAAAKDRRDQATFDGLVASVRGDKAELERIIGQAVEIRRDIMRAEKVYRDAIEESGRDPDAFLARCRQ